MAKQTVALEVKNLCCERQDQLLFENLNFTAKSGQLVRIHGKNGSGKSSLLKIITGLLSPLSGEVNWNLENIKLDPTKLAKDLTYIGHKPAIKSELSVVENVQALSGLRNQLINKQSLTETLQILVLNHYEDVEAGHLSQGQQRRIALARLWLEDTYLWVLDEPYAALDKDAVKLINNKISQFLAKGNIVIMTSHQDVDDVGTEVLDIWLG